MPITSGDFSASQLAKTVVIADQMFGDSMLQADYKADIAALTAITQEQNARIDVLKDQEKDREVKIHWINMCANAVEDDDGDDCDLDGPELGSDSKTYGLNVKKSFKFTVDEMAFRTNDYNMEQAVAVGFLKADKALCEAMTATTIARIESFKGTNLVTDGVGTVNAGTTETDIAAADWNANLFAHFYRVAKQNDFSNAFLLSGVNLFEDWIKTKAAQDNSNGKGDSNLYDLMRMYFDIKNIEGVNSPAYKTYMINRGAIAFAAKNYYGPVPQKFIQQHRYSIQSRFLPNVRFDVHYTNRCSGETSTGGMVGPVLGFGDTAISFSGAKIKF